MSKRLDDKDLRARALFGEFVAGHRDRLDLSLYQMGEVLGVSHATVWCWEQGQTMPKSLGLFQALNVVCDGEVCGFMRELVGERGVRLTRAEERAFRREWRAERLRGGPNRCRETYSLSPYRLRVGERDARMNLQMGEYLRRSRIKRMQIDASGLSRMLDVAKGTVQNWESGAAFPRNLVVYRQFDLMLEGEWFDVMFGMVKERPIRLAASEVRGIRSKLRAMAA